MISGLNMKWLIVFAVVLMAFSTLIALDSNGIRGLLPDCDATAGDADHLNYNVGSADLICGTNYETEMTLISASFPQDDSGININGCRLETVLSGNILRYYGCGHEFRVADRVPLSVDYTRTLVTVGTTFENENVLTSSSPTSGANKLAGGLGVNDNIYVKNEIALSVSGDPATHTNYAQIYAKDTAGTAEVFVQDDAGNITQISPHDGDNWVFESRNIFSGKTVVVDMEVAFAALELITGNDSIITVTVDVSNIKDWDQEQARIFAESIAERDRLEARYLACEVAGNLGCVREDLPPVYVIKAKPQWLIDSELSR